MLKYFKSSFILFGLGLIAAFFIGGIPAATIVNATGAFTGDDKYIILTVLSPSQAVKLRNFIKEHDPKAFLLVSNTSEIIGKGFHSV
jgi:hypothetical protein